jgi:hypothetical protein
VSTPSLADDSGSERWYLHPRTGERFLSVTSALGYIAKHFLSTWAAKLSAEAAIDAWETVQAAAAIDPCELKGSEACGVCRTCVSHWLADRHNVIRETAGDLGSRFHEAVEHQSLFGPGGEVDEDVQPFLDAYNNWADRAKPTIFMTEATVINRRFGYAGTLDVGLEFGDGSELPKKLEHLRGRVLLGDWKTGKSVDKLAAWQENAYRFGEAILLPDGTEEPLPHFEAGLILHIRPESEGGVKMREAVFNAWNFNQFIYTLRVAEGMMAPLGDSLSRPARLAPLKVSA